MVEIKTASKPFETSEMIERVAKALGDNIDSYWDARIAARLAIEAMREPTKAMIDAAECHDDHSTRYVQATDCVTHWQAMIDAALAK
jgi:5-enolpyruvylshikimate-3-phosphate synthase